MQAVVRPIESRFRPDLRTVDETAHDPFAQAMPAVYQQPGAGVAAYRAYYTDEKVPALGAWTRRDPPGWCASSVAGHSE